MAKSDLDANIKQMLKQLEKDSQRLILIQQLKKHLPQIKKLVKLGLPLTAIVGTLVEAGVEENIKDIISAIQSMLDDEESEITDDLIAKSKRSKKSHSSDSADASVESSKPTVTIAPTENLAEPANDEDRSPTSLPSAVSESSLPPASNNPSIPAEEYKPPIPDRKNPALTASIERNRAAKSQQDSEGR